MKVTSVWPAARGAWRGGRGLSHTERQTLPRVYGGTRLSPCAPHARLGTAGGRGRGLAKRKDGRKNAKMEAVEKTQIMAGARHDNCTTCGNSLHPLYTRELKCEWKCEWKCQWECFYDVHRPQYLMSKTTSSAPIAWRSQGYGLAYIARHVIHTTVEPSFLESNGTC